MRRAPRTQTEQRRPGSRAQLQDAVGHARQPAVRRVPRACLAQVARGMVGAQHGLGGGQLVRRDDGRRRGGGHARAGHVCRVLLGLLLGVLLDGLAGGSVATGRVLVVLRVGLAVNVLH